MIPPKTVINYWFTVEPYVYINIVNNRVLLYNTLDGVTIESDKIEVIELLQDILLKENCGVILLINERYGKKDINNFIKELREKYMGDIIDVSLSKGKPVQLLPFINFYEGHEIYRKQNITSHKNILVNLSEISIHVGHITDTTKLLSFLQSLPENLIFNLIVNVEGITNGNALLTFLDQRLSLKNILCSYKNIIPLQPTFDNNFSYRISIDFPIDIQQWNKSIQLLLNQTLPVEYIFDVRSVDDCQQAKQLIEQFQIEKYQLNPIYTGNNIGFFEENVFLTKENILSTIMSIKDIFINQAMNVYDFGKINVMANGDAYANVNHPTLGNVYTHSIHEIVSNEIEEGKSWFRIRDQAPCNNCLYQWLCPSPSNHEIAMDRPNLCHIKQ
jgi:pseudo-rSAM protein